MEHLKRILWDRWGVPSHPAEWDGLVYGGGRGSQRFWEYLWVIEQLKGDERQILDVGAGSAMFLPDLLRNQFLHVEAVDPALSREDKWNHRKELSAWIAMNPQGTRSFDCVTCVSVVEHLPDPLPFFSDLAQFARAKLVITLELGFDPPGFEYQVSMKKLYAGLACFGNHYLSKMEACPVWADNSHRGHWRPFGMVLMPRPIGEPAEGKNTHASEPVRFVYADK